MQTSFTEAQLADPDIAASDRILRNCVHCGFCTATCPTYVTLGDENDSPRGRIYLIKNMLESGAAPGPVLTKHIDRCLTCLSCMSTCPSGVDYMHLVEVARERVEEQNERPFADRRLRDLLAFLLPRPHAFRLAMRAGMAARALGISRFFQGRLRAMFDMLPHRLPAAAVTDRPGVFTAEGLRRGRVALLAGCAQPVLDPGINAAAIRLLNRMGVEVVVAPGAGCCGALTHHMGREDDARETARRNLHAWAREADGEGLDAIVITTSGCGTTIKDYAHLFRRDRDEVLAQRISALAKDVTEFLATTGLPPRKRELSVSVAYHAACSLQHGQSVREAPKDLLRQVGFTVHEIAESHICCGSAGTYNILQPEIAGELRRRKIDNIRAVRADVVSAGNIGCLQHLKGGLATPMLHTVELLDWATGGPRPSHMQRTES